MVTEETAGEAAGETDSETPAVVAVGSAIVDHNYRLSNLPEPDGGAFVREEWTGFGGVAGNVACAASRLGREAGVIARVGAADADAVVGDLRDRGVDTARIRRGEEAPTYSMVLRGPTGERMVLTGGEASEALRLAPADWPYLEAAGVVVTSAYAPDPVVTALLAARREGRIEALAFDLSGPLSELQTRGVAPGTIDDAAATADLFVAGEVALGSYCSHHGVDVDAGNEERAVELLRDLGLTRGALTRGESGSVLVTPGRRVRVPAFDVAVADETGAGDAFVAGLVDAWLLDDRDAADAGRHAAAVAALNCTGTGARGGLPTRESVAAFREARCGADS
ncbi:MAG: carbohydrate kinase family protein [Salinirussus sp.]